MSEKLDTLVEQLGKLTVMEAADLAKKLEEAWGCLLYTSPSPRD